MGLVIGLDIGTSGTKGVIVNAAGAVIASAQAAYPLSHPKPLWAEQEPAHWHRAVLEVFQRLVHSPGIQAQDIKALGLTGQMHGAVFLDKQRRVLRPALLWCDQRTARQCDAITQTIGASLLIEMVGNPALTGFTAPKILWLREEEPETYAKVCTVLLPKDYVRLQLTGALATDAADASGTLLFDVGRRTWSAELLSRLDIPASFFPPVYEGPEITGVVTAEVAAATGLPEGLPVVAGGGDQAAGGVGCGVVRSGVVSSTIGTSGVVFACTDAMRQDPQGRVHAFCHALPESWHVMGVVLSAGGSLRWFRDVLSPFEMLRAAEMGSDVYDLITAAAVDIPPGAEGLLFLPYLTGERTPHRDPFAKGAFIGLSPRHTRAHLARAVLEGVAYALRDSVEIFQEMNVPMTEVRCSGGGAKSRVWRQIQADVLQQPLTVTNVDEGPAGGAAYGAALLAMPSAGLFGSVQEACDALIRVVEICPPEPSNAEVYENRFRAYQRAYAALAPGFRYDAEHD